MLCFFFLYTVYFCYAQFVYFELSIVYSCSSLLFVDSDILDMFSIFFVIAYLLLLISFHCSSDGVVFFHYPFYVEVSCLTCPPFLDPSQSWVQIVQLVCLIGQPLHSTCAETWGWVGKTCVLEVLCIYFFS